MESISTEGPVAVTSSSKKIGEYNRKGFTIVTWMNGADFAAEAHEDGVWKWGTGLDSNRGRAERLVEEWIDGEVARREATSAPGPDPLPAEAGEVLDEMEFVAGWRIEAFEDRARGTWKAVVSPVVNEVAGGGPMDDPPFFKGYQRREQALADAKAWAAENALEVHGSFNGCDFKVYRYHSTLLSTHSGWSFNVTYPGGEGEDCGWCEFEGALIYKTPAIATERAQAWCGAYRVGEQLPAEVYPEEAEAVPPRAGEGVEALENIVAAEPAPEPAPTPVPVAAPPVEKAIDEARASGGLQVVEQPAPASAPADPHVDELMELLQHKRELKKHKRQLEAAMASAKSKLKACDDEIAELDAQIDAVLEDERRQVQLPLSPATRVNQPAPAPPPPPATAATAMPRQPIRWTANSVELEIMVNGMGERGFCARVFVQRGNAKQMITGAEGYGETWEQAVEAAKAAASVVLADCDPGETTPKADAGPVADGPRLPPKRGRKPKLKGKTAAEVEAALRGAMTLDEAAKTIGCTAAELEGWAREAYFTLSKYLGKDTGGDEPAPKTSKKPRGGKRGGK